MNKKEKQNQKKGWPTVMDVKIQPEKKKDPSCTTEDNSLPKQCRQFYKTSMELCVKTQDPGLCHELMRSLLRSCRKWCQS